MASVPPHLTLLLDRFRRLPPLARETWQGGIVRMPVWVEHGPDGEPWRPWGAVWVSLSSERVHLKMEPAPDQHGPELALEALLEFLQHNRKHLDGRASRLHVADPELAGFLSDVLGAVGPHVEVVARLDAVREVLRAFAEHDQGPLPPGCLDGEGVTIARMAAFADAAALFYRATPWEHLSNDDLLRVESSVPTPDHQFLVVLGHAGRSFGLGFYRTADRYREMAEADEDDEPDPAEEGARSILFDSADGIPFDDHDAWIEHGWPLAGPDAYPFAAHYARDETVARPNTAELTFLEALLRALAATTEDELDSGRWKKTVETADGPRTVALSLPELLDPPPRNPARLSIFDMRRASERLSAEMSRFFAGHTFENLDAANKVIAERFSGRKVDEIPSTASTSLEHAQDLMYEAFEAIGRRRIALARRALALSPDCADAYVLLGEHATTPGRAIEQFTRGVEAGERALGGDVDRRAGEMWGDVKTRPYMRARMGLAQALEDAGRIDEAIADYQALLRLNPNDNQGARDLLVPLLLEHGRDVEAGALLETFKEGGRAAFDFANLLWLFRTEGDSPATRRVADRAVKANPDVPYYLHHPDEAEAVSFDQFALGSEEEAIACAQDLGAAWRATPGALDWLAARMTTLARTSKARRSKRAKGKKGRR